MLEKPTTLNIPGFLTVATIIKEKIKYGLSANIQSILNVSIRKALIHEQAQGAMFILFLMDIKPLFPRFSSELYSSSF